MSELAAGDFTLDVPARVTRVGLWELRGPDTLVGVIDRSTEVGKVRGRERAWVVRRERRRRRLGWRFVFSPLHDSEGTICCFYPRTFSPGGTVTFSDDDWWDLRPPGLRGKAWQLVGNEDDLFAEATVVSLGWGVKHWDFTVDPEAAGQRDALLLLLAASYVIVDHEAHRQLCAGC